jgi:hypothetical protein
MDAQILAGGCAVLLSACACLSCRAAPGDLVVHSPSRVFSATVTVTPDGRAALAGLEGPSTSAALDGDELRGRVDGSPVFLTLDDRAMRITGLLGQQPVDLRVRGTDDGFHVMGLFAGTPSEYDVGWSAANGLHGKIGKCSYELQWKPSDDGFAGQRECSDGRIEPVFFKEPLPMGQKGDFGRGLTATQTVTLLTLALAR